MGRAGTADSAWRRRVVLLLLTGAILGGCAREHPVVADPGGSPSTAGPAATSPSAQPDRAASGTPTAHAGRRPYSDVNPPPRRGGPFVVKVLIMTRDAPGGVHPLRTSPTGPAFWGEEVRTCLDRSAPHPEAVGWADWRAQGTDGRTYPADPAVRQPLRRPAYPVHRILSPGECATGYWLITLPRGRAIRAIQFAPGGGPALIEWPSMM